MRTSSNAILATAAFATLAFARTDLEGCTRTDVSSPAGASYAWYVPGTGEICEILDCGGGRAPPKTTVPGCAAYSGTETYSPSYLAGYQASATAAPSTTAETQSTTDSEEASSTSSFDWDSAASAAGTEASSWDLYTTLGSATGPITDIPTSVETEVASSSSSEAAAITTGETTALPSESSTLVAQTTNAGNAPNNGTVSGGHSDTNGTINNGTAAPSAPISDSGAAKALVGGAGFVIGLVGLVAAL